MDIVNVVYEEMLLLQRSRILSSKVSSHRIQLFATDLALIALSVRTGYLMDAFTIGTDQGEGPGPVWGRVIRILRKKHPAFERVAHIYDPSSEQSFCVNVSLLLSRSQSILSGSSVETSEERDADQTIYVSLASDGSSSPKISSIPQEIVAVLRHLVIAMQIRHTSVDTAPHERPSTMALPTELRFDVMVPLAGFILEYPVALSPTPISGSDMSAFLSQVPLHVYECALDLGTDTAGSRRHLLMKFSIPSVLASVHPSDLSPSIVTSKLETKLNSRLEQAFPGSVPSLTVVYNTVTLDRVAL